jgi:integrase
MPKRRPETIRFLTLDKIKHLFNVVKTQDNKQDYTLLLTPCQHGLRASEVRRLHKIDIDFKQLRIYCHHLNDSPMGSPMEPAR